MALPEKILRAENESEKDGFYSHNSITHSVLPAVNPFDKWLRK